MCHEMPGEGVGVPLATYRAGWLNTPPAESHLLGKSNFISSGPRGHYLNESFGDLSLVNHLSGLWAG